MTTSNWFTSLWRGRSPQLLLQKHLIELDEEPGGDELGRGAYGAVFKVKYNGANCVAKRVLEILTGLGAHQHVGRDQYQRLVDKFRAECDLLSKFRHPNVVQFIGVCQPTPDPRYLTLVMEEMHMNLDQLITTHKPINEGIKLQILLDVSAGLIHIHSHDVIHRDINAGNVLLNSELRAKIADFGMSRILPSNMYTSRPLIRPDMTMMPGAPDFMPPEAKTGTYDVKLDTFSFGHLMLYLVVEKYPTPFVSRQDLHNTEDRSEQIEIKKRIQWLDKMGKDHELHELTIQCLMDEPKDRPTMIDINKRVSELKSEDSSFHKILQMKLDEYKIAVTEMFTNLPDNLADNQDAITDLQQQLEDRTAEFQESLARIEQLEEDKGRLESDKERLEEENQRLETEKVRLEADMERLEADMERLEEENQRLETVKERLEADRQTLQTVKERLEADKVILETDKQRLEKENQQQNREKLQLERDKRQLETEKHQLQMNYQKSKRSEQRLEGYYRQLQVDKQQLDKELIEIKQRTISDPTSIMKHSSDTSDDTTFNEPKQTDNEEHGYDKLSPKSALTDTQEPQTNGNEGHVYNKLDPPLPALTDTQEPQTNDNKGHVYDKLSPKSALPDTQEPQTNDSEGHVYNKLDPPLPALTDTQEPQTNDNEAYYKRSDSPIYHTIAEHLKSKDDSSTLTSSESTIEHQTVNEKPPPAPTNTPERKTSSTEHNPLRHLRSPYRKCETLVNESVSIELEEKLKKRRDKIKTVEEPKQTDDKGHVYNKSDSPLHGPLNGKDDSSTLTSSESTSEHQTVNEKPPPATTNTPKRKTSSTEHNPLRRFLSPYRKYDILVNETVPDELEENLKKGDKIETFKEPKQTDDKGHVHNKSDSPLHGQLQGKDDSSTLMSSESRSEHQTVNEKHPPTLNDIPKRKISSTDHNPVMTSELEEILKKRRDQIENQTNRKL